MSRNFANYSSSNMYGAKADDWWTEVSAKSKLFNLLTINETASTRDASGQCKADWSAWCDAMKYGDTSAYKPTDGDFCEEYLDICKYPTYISLCGTAS